MKAKGKDKGKAGNPRDNHHLMRVRVKMQMFNFLQDAAEDETERLGSHVTVSEIVRAACHDYLIRHETMKRLQNIPNEFWEQKEDIRIALVLPML